MSTVPAISTAGVGCVKRFRGDTPGVRYANPFDRRFAQATGCPANAIVACAGDLNRRCVVAKALDTPYRRIEAQLPTKILTDV